MSKFSKNHLSRVKDAVKNVYTAGTYSKWVEKHIIFQGKPLSFSDDHYFQREIVDDKARVNNVVKPAQIGSTIATMSLVAAATCTQDRMSVIYALPSSTLAQTLVTTKLNPLFQGTPEIKRLINPDVDNLERKQIGKNFLYIMGARSDTAAFSISADMLIVDEFDKCDPDTAKEFRSRLQGSPHRIIRQFSTPTVEGVGISREAETSRRYRHFATCEHCGNRWLPSFHTDVVVPGYDKLLSEITKQNIKDLRWREAHWKCPTCHKNPNLHRSRMEWVCENPGDNYEANTYFITPATAYGILTPSYLIGQSTEYNRRSDFLNQGLGETSSEQNDQLTPLDIEKALVSSPLDSSELHCMGADMGQICTVAIGRLTMDLEGKEQLLVVHREQIPLGNFEIRRRELCAKYRVLVSVHDTQPETDLIRRITEVDKNAYGANFSVGNSTELLTVKHKDPDMKVGRMNLREAKINRTKIFDALLAMFKRGEILIHACEQDDVYQRQYLDMRRVQVFDRNQELIFTWQKSAQGEDHGYFGLAYLLAACRLRGTARGGGRPMTIPLLSTFQVKESR